MSIPALAWALTTDFEDPVQKLVAIVVADCSGCDNVTAVCFTPPEKLARLCGLTQGQFAFHLARLRQLGIIQPTVGFALDGRPLTGLQLFFEPVNLEGGL